MASAQLWLLLSLLVMGVIYYRAGALEERKFLAGELSEVYREYRRRTGMFVPRLWPGAAPVARKEPV